MKIIKDNIYATISNLHDELDNAIEERKVIDFVCVMVKVNAVTKIKKSSFWS